MVHVETTGVVTQVNEENLSSLSGFTRCLKKGICVRVEQRNNAASNLDVLLMRSVFNLDKNL